MGNSRMAIGVCAVLLVPISGCDSGNGTGSDRPVPVASVQVVSAADSVVIGASVQLRATPKDASGGAITGRSVLWTSSDTSVATVDTLGVVTPRKVGGLRITARVDGQEGEAALRVVGVQPVVRILSPGDGTVLKQYNASVSFTIDGASSATAYDSVTVRLNNGAFIRDAFQYGLSSVQELSEGDNTVTIRAYRQGAVGEASVRLTARVPAARYALTYLGDLGGGASRPADLNNRGDVVGTSRAKDGQDHAFLWSAGTMYDLGAPGEASSAVAVNEARDVVGSSSGSCGGVRWRAAQIVETLPCGSKVLDLNEDGAILYTPKLTSTTSVAIRDAAGDQEFKVARESGESVYGIGAFNRQRQIVTNVSWMPSWRVYLSEGATRVALNVGRAVDINEAGQVVGHNVPSIRSPGPQEAYVCTAAACASLGTLKTATQPAGINNGGDVAGTDGTLPFIHKDGAYHRIVLTDPAWTIIEVTGINDVRQIVARARNASTGAEGAVLLVPSP